MDTAYTDAALNSGTCSGAGVNIAAGCHSDDGNWSRQWNTAADSTVTAVGSARCDVCHGQWGSWRAGTSHEGTNGGATSTRGSVHDADGAAANSCEDCHGYPSLSVNHNTTPTHNINVNAGTGIDETAQGSTAAYCSSCHSDDGLPATLGTHTYTLSAFSPVVTVAGTPPSCDGCHGTPPVGAVAPDRQFAHNEHYTAKGWASDTTNCVSCHPATHGAIDGT